jgi:hypothetical protein
MHFYICYIEESEHLHPILEINQEKRPFIGTGFKFQNLRASKTIDIVE